VMADRPAAKCARTPAIRPVPRATRIILLSAKTRPRIAKPWCVTRIPGSHRVVARPRSAARRQRTRITERAHRLVRRTMKRLVRPAPPRTVGATNAPPTPTMSSRPAANSRDRPQSDVSPRRQPRYAITAKSETTRTRLAAPRRITINNRSVSRIMATPASRPTSDTGATGRTTTCRRMLWICVSATNTTSAVFAYNLSSQQVTG